MATKATLTIEWSSSSSVSISSGGTATSDAFAIADDCELASINAKADNDGTPASGDTVTFKLLHSYDGGTTYQTANNAPPAAIVDTYSTNGEDPGVSRMAVDPAATHVKLYAKNNSSGRAITVSATGKQITTS